MTLWLIPGKFFRVNLVRSGVIYTRFSFLLITYLSNLDCLPQSFICAYASEMLCTASLWRREYDEERKDRQVRVTGKEALFYWLAVRKANLPHSLCFSETVSNPDVEAVYFCRGDVASFIPNIDDDILQRIHLYTRAPGKSRFPWGNFVRKRIAILSGMFFKCRLYRADTRQRV